MCLDGNDAMMASIVLPPHAMPWGEIHNVMVAAPMTGKLRWLLKLAQLL